MSKYFSSTKTKTNGYDVRDIAIVMAYLDDADKVIGTPEYKTMINNAVLLLSDKERKCYLDLSGLIDKDKNFIDNKMTAAKFIKDVNRDILIFIEERAAVRSRSL